MPEFASPEWVEALDAASRAIELGDGAGDLEGVVLQQVVGDDAWTVTVRDGRVRYAAGRDPRAGVTLTTDRETGEAIARGASSAQRAFAEGSLRIGGDPTLLVALAPVLSALDAVLPIAPHPNPSAATSSAANPSAANPGSPS